MRKKLITWHLWLGLMIGLLWALQGLSGALLVFHREVDRSFGPVASAGSMASLDVIAGKAAAKAASPIERIGIIDRRGDILAATYHDMTGTSRTLLIDAHQARIVGSRLTEPTLPTSGSVWAWLFRFHDSLAGGKNGELVLATSGFFLLTSAITGLWIAWPKRGTIRTTFNVRRWRSIEQKLYGWHRATGLVTGFALLITVPCGLYLIFAAEIRPQIARWIPHTLPYSAAPVPKLSTRTLRPQQAYRIAQNYFPHATFVSLTMPSAKTPVYTLRLRQPEELRAWSGTTSVTIDAANGRVLHRYDAIRAPASNRIADAIFSIHNGEISGIFGRLLIMLTGLALPTLYITGVWAWIRKYRNRRNRKKPSKSISLPKGETE